MRAVGEGEQRVSELIFTTKARKRSEGLGPQLKTKNSDKLEALSSGTALLGFGGTLRIFP